MNGLINEDLRMELEKTKGKNPMPRIYIYDEFLAHDLWDAIRNHIHDIEDDISEIKSKPEDGEKECLEGVIQGLEDMQSQLLHEFPNGGLDDYGDNVFSKLDTRRNPIKK